MIRGMVMALAFALFLALFVSNSRAMRVATCSSHAEDADDPWSASKLCSRLIW